MLVIPAPMHRGTGDPVQADKDETMKSISCSSRQRDTGTPDAWANIRTQVLLNFARVYDSFANACVRPHRGRTIAYFKGD